jgi:cell division protease FtsH
MKNFSKNIFVWIVISLILLALFNIFKNSQMDNKSFEYSYSSFLEKTSQGQIKSVKIEGNNIYGETIDGLEFFTYSPRDPNLIEKLSEANVSICCKC